MLSSAELLDQAAEADTAPRRMGLRIGVGGVMLVLTLAVVAVIAASFSAMLSLASAGLERQDIPLVIDQLSKVTKFLLKFDAAGEQTVAAWLSSVLMLLCAMILFYIAAMKRELGQAYAMHWLALSIIFLGLSMDETVGFHEMTIKPMRALFGAEGLFLYAWVIPGMALVAIVGAVYTGFLLHLEPSVRARFIVAGGLFVGGALGFEMLEGVFAALYRQHMLLREAAAHVEDGLEFAGILLFLHTLLRYTQAQARELRIRLD